MKNNQSLKVFESNDFGDVRTMLIEGEPWFVAADVCRALEIGNPTKALYRLDGDEKMTLNLSKGHSGQHGGAQSLNIVNEPGLYTLVLGSRKPEAKAFKRWITHEVIPEIRRTGAYSLPATYSEALRALADAEEKREQLALENQTMRPKAEFYDAVVDSKTAIPMGDVAKILDFGIGRNRLFEFLRQKGILMRNNVPKQEYIDRGYFRVVETKFTAPDGSTRINVKTLVLQRGVDYIRKLLDSSFLY